MALTETLVRRSEAPTVGEIASRLATFDRIRLPFPRQEQVMAEFDKLRLMGLAGRDFPQKGMTLLAGTGSGKTETARRYCARLQESRADGGIPALIVPLEATGTKRSLFASILSALGDDFAHSGTEAKLKERVLRTFKHEQIELLIVDEIQHVAHRAFGQDVADTLKRFLDDAVVPIVFMGTLAASPLFERNAELRGRLLTPCHLEPLTEKPSDLDLLTRFLREFDAALVQRGVFDDLSQLDAPDVVIPLQIACNGYLGQLVNILRAATDAALKKGEDCLTVRHFSQAVDRWSVAHGFIAQNPFKTQWVR